MAMIHTTHASSMFRRFGVRFKEISLYSCANTRIFMNFDISNSPMWRMSHFFVCVVVFHRYLNQLGFLILFVTLRVGQENATKHNQNSNYFGEATLMIVQYAKTSYFGTSLQIHTLIMFWAYLDIVSQSLLTEEIFKSLLSCLQGKSISTFDIVQLDGVSTLSIM